MPLKGSVTKHSGGKPIFAFVFDGKPSCTLRQAIESPDFSPAKQTTGENCAKSREKVKKILQGIAAGLFHLNQVSGTIHGNVNPDGILVSPFGTEIVDVIQSWPESS